MRSLKKYDELAEFRFFGGDLMAAEGGTRVKHYKELAYMGFVPVLLHLGTIFSNMKRCKEDIVAWKPDVVILVDYPGFNLNIAKFLKKKTLIPVYYYISCPCSCQRIVGALSAEKQNTTPKAWCFFMQVP